MTHFCQINLLTSIAKSKQNLVKNASYYIYNDLIVNNNKNYVLHLIFQY